MQPESNLHRGAIATPLAVLLGVLPAAALTLQDWYVDVNAPLCPGGIGTQARPFCDIMDAVNAASDGDTIHIAPGTYFENVVLDEDLSLIGTGGELVTILDGTANGSVVHVSDSVVTLTGLTLTNGTGTLDPFSAAMRGGGLRAYSGSVRLMHCTLSGNSADYGGGVDGGANYLGYFGGDVVLDDCLLTGNTASSSGGGAHGPTTLLDCVVSNNMAGSSGGGLFGDIALENSSVNGNSAVVGGGIAGGGIGAHFMTVKGSTVTGNYATYGGGGIGAGGSVGIVGGVELTLVNSTVSGNATGPSGLALGGGILLRYGSLTIQNALVSDNAATLAGGLYCVGAVSITNSTVTGNTGGGITGSLEDSSYAPGGIQNSVLWNNGGSSVIDFNGGVYLTVEHNLIAGGWPGLDNLDADPLFVDPLNSDFRLQPGSPCIDAGNNMAVPSGIFTDLAGKRRFIDDPLTPYPFTGRQV